MSSTQHWQVYEWEADSGYRFWSKPMKTAEEARAHCAEQERLGYAFSDCDCPTDCPSSEHDTDPNWIRWRAEAAASKEVPA